MADDKFSISNGLAVLEPELLRLVNLLEVRFRSLASEVHAKEMRFPPLISVKALDNFDCLHNFPHLTTVVNHIAPDHRDYYKGFDTPSETIPASHLSPVEYALPTAACYNVYLYLQNRTIEQTQYITTVAQCFRNEDDYDELKRLWGFTMREIVCIGSVDSVKAYLAFFKTRIKDFVDQLGLPVAIQFGKDPFYKREENPKALMQEIFPVKEEVVFEESIAIASINFHLNFFGERCNILTTDGRYAYSGCVAFGIERWIHALLEQFNGDFEKIEWFLTVHEEN